MDIRKYVLVFIRCFGISKLCSFTGLLILLVQILFHIASGRYQVSEIFWSAKR